MNILTVENMTYTLFYIGRHYLNLCIYIPELLRCLVNPSVSSYMGGSSWAIGMPIYMEGFRKILNAADP